MFLRALEGMALVNGGFSNGLQWLMVVNGWLMDG
jgi:hypothetical protein